MNRPWCHRCRDFQPDTLPPWTPTDWCHPGEGWEVLTYAANRGTYAVATYSGGAFFDHDGVAIKPTHWAEIVPPEN